MSFTTRPQKDKPQYAASPRLIPRPTAASSARAARNATNRNLAPLQRQSPNRGSPTLPKGKSLSPRISQKSDSTSDIKGKSLLAPRISQKSDSTSDIKGKSLAPHIFQKSDSISDIKGKSLDPLISQKSDSTSDIKINRSPLCEPTTDHNVDVSLTVLSKVENQQVVDPYVVIDNTVVVLEAHQANDNADYAGAGVPLQEIQKNDLLEIKHMVGDAADVQEDRESWKGHHLTDQNRSAIQTPPSSRPMTPKSLPSRPPSRPQTPRAASRPATPAVSRPTTPANPRQGTPVSRPNTPQSAIAARPAGRSPSPQPHYQIKDDDDIKTAFTVKQRQFNRMKKELDLKQQAILEVFDTLRALRERMNREGLAGGGEGFLQELVVFNVGDWTSEEVAQLCRDATASSIDGSVELIRTTMPIDDRALKELDAKVTNVPSRFADLCLQAFTGRQELIDWVKELIESNALKEDLDGGGECLERIARYNAEGLELCETLRELKSRAEDAVDTVTQLSRRAWRERSALVAVGESLVREVARLRQDIEMRVASMAEMREVRIETELSKALEEARRELDEERTARAVTKDKLATSESQLRQMRGRVSKMDRQLREAEASISSLTGTVKSLEDQSRQKEVQLEARARKLKETLKTGEMTSGHLLQQRNALQTEVTQLKEQIDNLTKQHKSALQELTNQLKETNADLEEKRTSYQKEVNLRESAEAALIESHQLIEELKTKIAEFENSKPNPDLPTEREMDLWAELQATKDTLRITEDEVTNCKREKVKFLETLTKIAESENKVGMQQKLAAELLSKEEIMGKMQIKIRELTKNIKLNEQKVIQYEQYVRALQEHNCAVANCLESPNGISYQDLQQEIMDLKMKLLEAVHRNEEWSELLVQKDQQIEQQEKTARAQARVIKVREELINMLKNKETEQSSNLTALQQDLKHRMKIVDEVNKQIASKADEIQELFGTLENKQQQIHRLEKIVLALEEQQRRAQAQRIRHEEKIAALEHELAAGGNRRERKFLFF